MIAYLQGKILEKDSKSVILLADNIGYRVYLSRFELEQCQKDQTAKYFIHAYIKEDLFDLYGFKNLVELDFFKKLISVSGVGPKSALNVFALAPVDELKRAITSGDAGLLQQVSGIGKKTAERLVVDLKEKFIVDLSEMTAPQSSDQQVVEALISLGYKQSEAQNVLRELSAEGDLATRIKEALKYINQ